MPGAVSYEITHTSDGVIFKETTASAGTITGLHPSSTYTMAVRVIVATSDATHDTSSSGLSASKAVTTSAAPETGPANGTYTFEPASNATWTQYNDWRSTSDDLYHGTYSSTNGRQAAFFFYSSRLSAAFPSGLGTKNVTRIQVYMKRLSTGGSSANQSCHWNLHGYTSRPSGTPAFHGDTDAGALAWGEGAWIDLPISWGEYLVNLDYRGISWGDVASRYMIADNSLSLSTPNGTLKITIGN